MHPALQNFLAIILGIALGSIVNMGIVMTGGSLIPPPDGVDVSDMESLKNAMHLFEPRHFLMPWLAHALGTLAGAFATARIAANRKLLLAMVIGVFFLIGGIANIMMLPSPLWFTVTDLALAYLPMAWLGARLVRR